MSIQEISASILEQVKNQILACEYIEEINEINIEQQVFDRMCKAVGFPHPKSFLIIDDLIDTAQWHAVMIQVLEGDDLEEFRREIWERRLTK